MNLSILMYNRLIKLAEDGNYKKLLIMVFYSRMLYFFLRKNVYLKILPSVYVENFNQAKIIDVEFPSSICFQEPRVYGELEHVAKREIALPPKRLIELRNATLIGGYQIIVDQKLIILEHAENPFLGFVAGIWTYIKAIKNTPTLVLAYFQYDKTLHLDEAILIAGRCDLTYFHWLIEYLGRTYVLAQAKYDQQTPLLVSSNMYKSQFEALQAVLPNWPILMVDKGTLLEVKKIIIPSISTYHPDRLDLPFWRTSGVCFRTLSFLREKIESGLLLKNDVEDLPNIKKIFLSRESEGHSGRNIVNNLEIKHALSLLGFEIVDPVKLSLKEQIKLFKSASIIIGAMGSAFTNLIFCYPNTIVIALSSPYTKRFCMQSLLASFAKCKYIIFSGDHPDFVDGDEFINQDYSLYGSSFTVNLKQLLGLLEELEIDGASDLIALKFSKMSADSRPESLNFLPLNSEGLIKKRVPDGQKKVVSEDGRSNFNKWVLWAKKSPLWYIYKKIIVKPALKKLCNNFYYGFYHIFLLQNIYLKNIKSLFTHRRNSYSYNLASITDYIEKNGIPSETIFAAEKIKTSVTLLESKIRAVPSGPYECEEHFPRVYKAMLHDVLVYGASSFIIIDRTAIAPDLFDIQYDLLHEEKHRGAFVQLSNSTVSYLSLPGDVIHLDEAAYFLNCCAANYAHWMTEVLPKLSIFCTINSFVNIPILLNSDLPQTILESVLLIVGDARQIFLVESSHLLRIKKLHLISTVGYVPYERRNNPALSDVSCDVGLKARVNGSFSLSAIQAVRKKILAPNLLRGDVLNTPKKIFIKRSGEVRRLINQPDIEALLHRLGFVTVAPEEMSFKEQAILFSSATHIVGPTGAALVNCIFCKSGTKVCVLMGNHPDMIFGYWAKILSPLEIDVTSYFGKTVKNSKRGIHADFAVDILKFEDFLLSSFL